MKTEFGQMSLHVFIQPCRRKKLRTPDIIRMVGPGKDLAGHFTRSAGSACTVVLRLGVASLSPTCSDSLSPCSEQIPWTGQPLCWSPLDIFDMEVGPVLLWSIGRSMGSQLSGAAAEAVAQPLPWDGMLTAQCASV